MAGNRGDIAHAFALLFVKLVSVCYMTIHIRYLSVTP